MLEHIAKFVKECGLLRHNRYLLPILSFVRMCCGVSEEEFEEAVRVTGLTEVVYSAEQIAEMMQAKVRQGFFFTRYCTWCVGTYAVDDADDNLTLFVGACIGAAVVHSAVAW